MSTILIFKFLHMLLKVSCRHAHRYLLPKSSLIISWILWGVNSTWRQDKAACEIPWGHFQISLSSFLQFIKKSTQSNLIYSMHLLSFYIVKKKRKKKVKLNPTTSSAPLALIVLTLTQITVTLRGRNVLYGRACLCRLLLLVLTYALCFNYCASVITTAERCVNICMGRDVWWLKLSAWICSSKLMWVDWWIIGNFTRHLIADLTTPRHHITWTVVYTFV